MPKTAFMFTTYSDSPLIAVSSNGIIREFAWLVPGEWNRRTQSRTFHELKVKTGNFCEFALEGKELQILAWNKSPERE